MPPRKEAPASAAAGPSKRARVEELGVDDGTGAGGQGYDEDDLEEVKTTRKEVNTAGYDSDSSDDGEGVVLSRKPGQEGEGGDSDDDMFADEPKKTVETATAKGKQKEKYLSLGDIEGQEFGAGGSDDDDDDDEGAKVQGGLDGPMGYEMSSFNMKDELQEGKFTEDGAYVAKGKDAMEVHDKWLEGVDTGKAAMRRAREAKRRQDEAEARRQQQEVDDLQAGSGREGKIAELVELLERGETVMHAMQRLGGQQGGGAKKSWAEKLKEKKAAAKAAKAGAAPSAAADVDMDGSAGSSKPAPSPAASDAFNRLSSLTSDLTSLGQLDIYSMSREALQRLLPPSTSSPAEPASQLESATSAGQPPPPGDASTYEYRFKMDYIKSLPEGERPVEREVFGPFPKRSILQWRSQGFFGGIGDVPERVELRKDGGEWKDFWGLFG